MAKRVKTVIIGIDGASFDFIDPLIEKNQLPHLKRVMERGSHGLLRSTWPPVTPPAWVSFYTGKNPGKHSVFGFVNYNDQPDKIKFDPVTSNSIQALAIWDIFAQNELKSCIINLPITYPTPKFDGICISGMGTPYLDADFVHPLQLKQEIMEKFPDFSMGWNPATVKIKNRVEWLKEFLHQEGLKKDLTIYLNQKDDFDLLAVVFEATDKSCHMTWNISHDQKLVEDLGLEDTPINLAYRRVDQYIGEIIDEVGEDVNLFIMSDHGFGAFKKFFFVNAWLHKEGYLKKKKVTFKNFRQLYQLVWREKRVGEILARLKLKFLNILLPAKVRMIPVRIPIYRKKNNSEIVDWNNTKAYADNYGIYINLKGREKTGLVEQGKEYADLVEEIREKLRSLTDPENGSLILEELNRKEEQYSGPYYQQGCDVIFKLKDDYVQHNSYFLSKVLLKRETGTHRLHGVFMAAGPYFKSGVEVNGANLIDILPTLLYAQGLQIPEDVDGRVLEECFTEDYLKRQEIAYFRENKDKRSISDAEVYNEDQRRIIEERLKILGYL